MVIGPSHLGLLLEDGRALRVAFSVIPERLDLSKGDQGKSSSSAAGGGGNGGGTATSASGSASASGGNGGSGAAGSSGIAGSGASGSKNSPRTIGQLGRSRARIMRSGAQVQVRSGSSSGAQGGSSSSRSTGVIIGSSSAGGGRSLVSVPAPFVPEDLVSQAQVVLQGKSRNVIIRELQRTNLDVNLAVNNLLSRDDEEGEDTEENSDNYVPEDLISLLDNGFHADNSVIIDADSMFSEEMFGYSNIRK